MPDVTAEQQGLARTLARAAVMIEQDPALGSHVPIASVSAASLADGMRCPDILAHICRAYSERPALGSRSYEIVTDQATGANILRFLPSFETVTYAELWDRVSRVATAWGCQDDATVGPNNFVCMLGFASVDLAIVELACMFSGAGAH